MNELQVVAHNNQRILTTQQLADGYGTESTVISNNFNRNKDRYTPGIHYFCLEGEELRAFRANHQIEYQCLTELTRGRRYLFIAPTIHKEYVCPKNGILLCSCLAPPQGYF